VEQADIYENIEVLEIEEDNSIQIDHHTLEDTLPSLPREFLKEERPKGNITFLYF